MNKGQREIQRKLRILRHAEPSGRVARTWPAVASGGDILGKKKMRRLPFWAQRTKRCA